MVPSICQWKLANIQGFSLVLNAILLLSMCSADACKLRVVETA